MATLAGQLAGVVVEQANRQRRLLVGLVAVTALAGGGIAAGMHRIAAQDGAVRVGRRHADAAAGDLVPIGLVASGAGESGSSTGLGGHVHIQLGRGPVQRRIQVTVLDAIAAATVVVAASTGGGAGLANVPGHHRQVHRVDELAGSRWQLGAFGGHFTGHARRLLVTAGVVTDQAIDLALGVKVELVVLPAVAHVTTLAEGFVGAVTDTEAVEHGLLAQLLPRIRVGVLPGPVPGVHHLLGRLGVAAQAGLGHLGARLERTLQFLEFAVVGGGLARPRCLGQCFLCRGTHLGQGARRPSARHAGEHPHQGANTSNQASAGTFNPLPRLCHVLSPRRVCRMRYLKPARSSPASVPPPPHLWRWPHRPRTPWSR